MGMYTELVFSSRLKKDTPKEVIQILTCMVNGEGDKYAGARPNHPLFSTARWDYMLRCDSYYFDGDTNSTLSHDDICDAHFLTIRCNFKNYEGELEKFLSWINPYLDRFVGEHLGHKRYEEDDKPTLLYYE